MQLIENPIENHVVKAANLRVCAGDKILLDDVSLQLGRGEVLAIIGANGAGKSTLLKTLSGERKIEKGEIVINNRALDEWKHGELARVRGVLPQESNLNFPFTAFEVALLGRTPHCRGSETTRDYEIACAAMEATDTAYLANRSFPTLSGGERQRVHLARVLAQVWEEPKQDARLLLLDEPTSSLDLTHQHATLGIARRFARRGAGVIVVLHDLNLAAQYADRILLLKRGRVVARGTPQEVLQPAIINDAYGVRVLVMPHPRLRCPLIVSLMNEENREPNILANRNTKDVQFNAVL